MLQALNAGASQVSGEKTPITKLVVVNANRDIIDTIESDNYDVIFSQSYNHAYSQIKLVQPNLVIVCMRIDDLAGFQVLTMLSLDPETKDIPVLTFTNNNDSQDEDEGESELSGGQMFSPVHVHEELMN